MHTCSPATCPSRVGVSSTQGIGAPASSASSRNSGRASPNSLSLPGVSDQAARFPSRGHRGGHPARAIREWCGRPVLADRGEGARRSLGGFSVHAERLLGARLAVPVRDDRLRSSTPSATSRTDSGYCPGPPSTPTTISSLGSTLAGSTECGARPTTATTDRGVASSSVSATPTAGVSTTRYRLRPRGEPLRLDQLDHAIVAAQVGPCHQPMPYLPGATTPRGSSACFSTLESRRSDGSRSMARSCQSVGVRPIG